MSASVAVDVREQEDPPLNAQLTMPGRNGGTLKCGNPGVRSQLVILQDMARRRLRKAIELAGKIVDYQPPEPVPGEPPVKPKYSVEDQTRAGEFLRRCTGMDREHPRAPSRTSFGVARAPAHELARTAAAATTPAPTPAPVRPQTRKRKKGPQDPEGLGGTRVASLPNDSVPNESLVPSEEPRGTS